MSARLRALESGQRALREELVAKERELMELKRRNASLEAAAKDSKDTV
jgi:hypothetical protein